MNVHGNSSRPRRALLTLLTLLLLVSAAWGSTAACRRLQSWPGTGGVDMEAREALYLPNGNALRFLSFGFSNVLSDLLWFQTISYFGRHYSTDHSYRWLGHMCDLVTTLNPRALHVYEFCSLMLAWEADAPRESVRILSKAIEEHPELWTFRYLRGLNQLFFLQDKERAKDDFVRGAELPGAPVILARLAAKQLAAVDNPETALAFLTQTIASTKDPNIRAALEQRLRETRLQVDQQQLKKAIALYTGRQGVPPRELSDLVQAGIVAAIPGDPFGGRYYYDAVRNEVLSTSKHKNRRALEGKGG